MAFLRNSGVGRQMLAIQRTRAAVASGVSLGRAKLFAVRGRSGFIVGIAGLDDRRLTGNLSGEQFSVLTSLLLVRADLHRRVARISARSSPGGSSRRWIGPTLLDQWFGIGRTPT